MIDTDDDVVVPPGEPSVEVSGELAVIVGSRMRNVAPDDVARFVLGYTCANDVTVRRWMQTENQWFRAKSSDTFCPLGPRLAHSVDLENAVIEVHVNDRVVSSGHLSSLAWSPLEVVSLVSRHLTLHPHDVVLTGSPAELVTVYPGDEVAVDITGVGRLVNRVATTAPILEEST